MSRSSTAKKKPWVKTDEDLLIIKQGEIKTSFGQNQIYRLRVVRWGKFQAVIEKRLFRYDKQLFDYVPGRTLGINLEDFQNLLQKKDQIIEILSKVKIDADQSGAYNSKKIAEQRKQEVLKEEE